MGTNTSRQPDLEELANRLAMPSGLLPHSDFDAGLTYIGQMVSHDIVANSNKNAASRRVSGAMDLESLYGAEPYYEFLLRSKETIFFNSDGTFKLNAFNDFDLPRTSRGIAIIPEQRNDENAIIAQLHLFWMKLHNYLLQYGYVEDSLAARKVTTLIFQSVVVEGFLKTVLDARVYKAYFEKNEQNILDSETESYLGLDQRLVPDYFAKASFRFGHSIVRNDYKLNSKYSFELEDLFNQGRPIPREQAIDWFEFFSKESTSINRALPMDTHISRPMENIPQKIKDSTLRITVRNISAGIKANLPSGQAVIKKIWSQHNKTILIELGLKEVAKEMTEKNMKKVLGKIDGLKISNLPLWPYILLESQLLGVRDTTKGGKHLGPLGSILNAECIRRSIRQSQFSVFTGEGYNFEKDVVPRLGKFASVAVKKTKEGSVLNFPKLIDIINRN